MGRSRAFFTEKAIPGYVCNIISLNTRQNCLQAHELAISEAVFCQSGTPERSSTAVGLSLELGTTIINHVVIGTSALANSNNALHVGTDGTLERGHVIVSVDGLEVDSRNIAAVFASGPVGSKVLVRARNESGKEYEVQLVRQYAPFGEFRKPQELPVDKS